MAGITLTACAGVQLGNRLGTIRDELKVSYLAIGNSHNDPAYRQDPGTNVVQVSNTTRWDNIGDKKSSVGIYWEHREEYSQSGGQTSINECVKTNIFDASLRF